MGIQVADNFSLKSKKPLDGRTQYATLAEMKAISDASLYEGCKAYVVATDKYYKYKSTNTVDETLGKWREDEGGGSGTGGHTIKNDGTAMTARGGLNFTDFGVSDDSTNDETDVKPHELTNAEITEILSNLSGLTGLRQSGRLYIPCGKVEAFFRETAPEGYLVCDGSEYVIADYPQLANILLNLTNASKYTGSDEYHFKVPDLRQDFLRGNSTSSAYRIGEHQEATMLPYMTVKNNGSIFIENIPEGGMYIDEFPKNIDSKSGNSGEATNATINPSSTGTSTSGDYKSEGYGTRPRNTVVLWCILAYDIYV